MNKNNIKNVLMNETTYIIAGLIAALVLFICLIWCISPRDNEPIASEVILNCEDNREFEKTKAEAGEEVYQFIEDHGPYLSDEQLISLSQMKYNMTHAGYLEEFNDWKTKYTELSDPIKQQKINDEEKARQEEEARLAAEAAAAQAASYVAYSEPSGSGVLTRSGGVNSYNGHRETWYSSNVLYHYRTGEWTLGADGVYRDKDGYVVVASPDGANEQIVDTSLGKGKAYDYCPGGSVDIYTAW